MLRGTKVTFSIDSEDDSSDSVWSSEVVQFDENYSKIFSNSATGEASARRSAHTGNQFSLLLSYPGTYHVQVKRKNKTENKFIKGRTKGVLL